MNLFQSTHSLRSATGFRQGVLRFFTVSIHALLAECDFFFPGRAGRINGFNPRTPCGVRPVRPERTKTRLTFQSTHSLRSATNEFQEGDLPCVVSIHALLAECDCSFILGLAIMRVSIHALLAECDWEGVETDKNSIVSIHALLAECDSHLLHALYAKRVSIHALLAECDVNSLFPVREK